MTRRKQKSFRKGLGKDMIDLHTHSTASDGIYSPSKVVEMAREAGINVMALTDHDTTDGLDEAIEAGMKYGVDVIPGIELKAEYDTELHILGYFINKDDENFKKFLSQSVIRRKERNLKYIKCFNEMGIDITYEEVIEVAGGEDSLILKPHFATVLMQRGIIKRPEEAYDNYFNKPPLKLIRLANPSGKEVIEAIKNSGGIAVLAHPFLLRKDDAETERLIAELTSYGLLGIEVFHSEHSEENRKKYLEYAKKYNLIVTGGTDFHGETVKPGLLLGTGYNNNTVNNDYSIVCELKDRYEENKASKENKENKFKNKRVSARGIIINNGKILTLKRTKPDRPKPYYVTPGGGREGNETLRNNVIREIKEEIDSECTVVTMFATLEDETRYQYFYELKLNDYENVHLGAGDGTEFIDPSRGTYEIEWLKLDEIENYNFIPSEIKDKLKEKFIKNSDIKGYYIIEN